MLQNSKMELINKLLENSVTDQPSFCTSIRKNDWIS